MKTPLNQGTFYARTSFYLGNGVSEDMILEFSAA